MHDIDTIIRAWKDDDYRLSLSSDEQRALPQNPAGMIELSGVVPDLPVSFIYFTFDSMKVTFVACHCCN